MWSAALWCGGAALLAREWGVPGAAVALVAITLWTLHRGGWGPAVVAFPVALAALPPLGETGAIADPPPARGPVRLAGTVTEVYRSDPVERQTAFRLRRGGTSVRCAVDAALDLHAGDRVRGVGCSDGAGWVRSTADQLAITAGPPGLRRLCTTLRRGARDAILARLPGEPGRLVAGLVLGRGPRLPEDLVTAHRATGLTHLLAVSGAHISMLAFLLGALWIGSGRLPLQRAGFRTVCTVVLLVYGGVTGFDPPVFRAVAAFLLAVWAQTAGGGRLPSLLTLLAVPAILTALLDPMGLLGVSFSLSYAAVYGLSLAGSWPHGRRLAQLAATVRASFWALVMTAPLTLHWFGQVAPWTLLGTPLLAPLVAALLAGGLLVAATSPWAPGLADLLAGPLGVAAQTYCDLVRTLARLPWSPVLADAAPDRWTWAATGCCAVAVVAALRSPRRRAFWASTCLCIPFFVDPGHGIEHITVDVGHGQACILRTTGHTVVVDCGSLRSPGRAARRVADALGTSRRVDLLVLTHGDRDHTSGVPDLVSRVPVAAIAAPAEMRGHRDLTRADRLGIPIRWLAPGECVEALPGFTVWCPDVPGAARNDRSLWLRADLGGLTALVPGDAEEAGIRAALAAGFVTEASPAVDVLLLPHHGRPNAMLDALLAAVRPRAAAVSAAPGDGLTDLGQRLADRGIPVRSTALHGTIRWSAGPDGPVPAANPGGGDGRGRR